MELIHKQSLAVGPERQAALPLRNLPLQRSPQRFLLLLPHPLLEVLLAVRFRVVNKIEQFVPVPLNLIFLLLLHIPLVLPRRHLPGETRLLVKLSRISSTCRKDSALCSRLSERGWQLRADCSYSVLMD